MGFNNLNVPKDTITRDKDQLDEQTGNIYESVVVLSKRADQIAEDIKMELHQKLEEFATQNESLEEIFENKEQIEVSRFYEALPKPMALAVEEFLQGKVYFRRPEDQPEG